ncbi:monofunctional biosynthetic peptidoglycan transglycosylase [Litoribacter ruber]|uniref:monofunctional biosynthetic peptidoglycan transglycosylase n=1 Tax=Litoribacter ruber TaxID=702568 RepID=UPI001BDA62F0|nr:monofunctional biosynthetic peptidoglycan transglycosylase [Litoribacter ruber]MBT0809816.1 monofunctional biosynthetic peptidoglycan transglycosylase [Litoribacter ruber]
MKLIKWLLRLMSRLLFWFLVLSVGGVVLFKFVPVPVTPLMLIRMLEDYNDENRQVKFSYNWKPLSEICPELPLAVVAAEDQKFLTHSGFDREAIEKAFESNKSGKRIRGGSSISQQTAKNVFLWPERSYLRKGLEAYFTVLIEFIWGKKRILEVYVNVIEMGPGIYGAEAAAKEYFRKPAAQLSRQEAALIAAVLPNPRRWNPSKPTSYNRQRQQWILRQMNNLGELRYEYDYK